MHQKGQNWGQIRDGGLMGKGSRKEELYGRQGQLEHFNIPHYLPAEQSCPW